MRLALIGVVLIGTIRLLAAAIDSVDDYVKGQLQPRRVPGRSLAVVQDGHIVKAEGYGVASLELRVPATARTVYEIGSISKQITANAVLLLVEDGKLQIDDLLGKYLDRLPPAWSGITWVLPASARKRPLFLRYSPSVTSPIASGTRFQVAPWLIG